MAKKMIRTILTIALLAVLFGCEPKPFKGIIVCKEYVKAHYVRRPRRAPQLVPSEWKLYVANKYAIRVFSVDSVTYTTHHVGEKIVMKEM